VCDWSSDVCSSDLTFVGLYEDTYDLPTINRRLVAYHQQSIEVI